MKKNPLHNTLAREELRQRMMAADRERTTASFYHYFRIEQPRELRDIIYTKFEAINVKGRVYIASEGVNAQVSFLTEKVKTFRELLRTIHPGLSNIRLNTAIGEEGISFLKLVVKVRKKIVADGLADSDFVFAPARHVDAVEFNRLSSDPATLVVDMRNHYESEVGHFEHAICPDVTTFREALPEVEKILQGEENKNILLYCTGGIRCEKASAYLKSKGFARVYQLDGGIIEYTRQVRSRGLTNKFKGKNFVFDERLGERISPDIISKCHQCGRPSDHHVNCANDACHILFIQCETCAARYENCCSAKCLQFSKLPRDEQIAQRKSETFNGSKFSKGRYKALSKSGSLDVS